MLPGMLWMVTLEQSFHLLTPVAGKAQEPVKGAEELPGQQVGLIRQQAR